MTKPYAPHTAVLSIQLEIYENLPTGECGKAISKEEMSQNSVPHNFVLSAEGETKEICLEKVKNLCQKIKELSRK